MNDLPQEQQELYKQTINELSAVWAKRLPAMYPATATMTLTTFVAAAAFITISTIGVKEFDSKAFGTLITDLYDELQLKSTQKPVTA